MGPRSSRVQRCLWMHFAVVGEQGCVRPMPKGEELFVRPKGPRGQETSRSRANKRSRAKGASSACSFGPFSYGASTKTAASCVLGEGNIGPTVQALQSYTVRWYPVTATEPFVLRSSVTGQLVFVPHLSGPGFHADHHVRRFLPSQILAIFFAYRTRKRYFLLGLGFISRPNTRVLPHPPSPSS
ncbi:hypothetical protein AG1IA_03160 [Rhizoctonia solani AG-1 IA]|uniref:Uncharacterized protein n=1 Tax=Thanatephorus cucumeris (strain AG1-IA) TaxID=983506 RepID=L8WXN4_THACA|nr:hypothetical protein AG1IA_03160 [Rhizoctonia solani AG-1 IA]